MCALMIKAQVALENIGLCTHLYVETFVRIKSFQFQQEYEANISG